jgi:uncharacterized protein YhdP
MTKRRKITVYINDQELSLWHGATVEHAVITYDQRVMTEVRNLQAWVVDARGSRVDLDGTLQNNVRLYVRYKQESNQSQ